MHSCKVNWMAALAAATLTGQMGCGDPTGTTGTADPATTIAINAGDGQSAAASTGVAIPPSVTVTSAKGNPVSGVSVTFAVATGGGSISGGAQTTNASGIATVGIWKLGATVGTKNTLTATSPGLIGSPLTFTATGVASVFASLTAGFAHTCGVTSGGTAYCWGQDASGQLGDGSSADRLTPVAVSGGLTFASLTAGRVHTCGVTTGGAGYCWGLNSVGQIGDGSSTTRLAPVAVSGGLVFVRLTAGSDHT